MQNIFLNRLLHKTLIFRCSSKWYNVKLVNGTFTREMKKERSKVKRTSLFVNYIFKRGTLLSTRS